MANVIIDVAAEFTGKKAFNDAGKATTGLEKNVKKLAKTFGVAFGATAVANFAKSSVKAFVEDESAARSLSVTVKNLGLDFNNNSVLIGRFIDSVEKQTGVLDDELRPAMDRILRATGDVAKSQELLNLALDISAGTGKTVTQVSQSLQKAYLGQTAALGRLGVGLSKAELATGNFEDIQQKLTKLFAGQALSAANSYAGQLAKLQVAANNAKETIGKGLVDALKLLAGDTSIDKLNEGLEKSALYVADLIRGIGVFIQKLKDIPVAGKAFDIPLEAYIQAIPVIGSYINILSALGKEVRLLEGAGGGGFTDSQNAFRLAAEKQAKIAAKAAALKLAAEKKAAAAAAAAKIAADKKAAANKAILAKAESIFNMEQIQIEAALKGQISADEKLRLELQRAILNQDFDLANKLQKQLEASQRATAALQGQLADIKPAPNPFALWIKSLEEIQLSLEKLYATGGGKIVPFISKDTSKMTTDQFVDYAEETAGAATLAAIEAEKTAAYAETFAKLMATGSSTLAGFASAVDAKYNYNFGDMSDVIPTGSGQTAFSSGVGVTVNVQGSILNGQDFVEIVNNALLNGQRTGLTQVTAGSVPTP
jgi:hypothetical protein